jgi:hypothetical protein
MTAQIENKGRNLMIQMAIVAIVAVVLIALAAKYIW